MSDSIPYDKVTSILTITDFDEQTINTYNLNRCSKPELIKVRDMLNMLIKMVELYK